MDKLETRNQHSVKETLKLAYIVIISTFVFFIILATLAYREELKLVEYTNTISKHNFLPRKMEHLLSKLKDCEIGTRGFLATRDSFFLEPQMRAVKDIDTILYDLNNYQFSGVISQSDMKVIRNLSYGLINHQKLQLNAPEEKRLFVIKQGKLKMDSIRILFDSLRDVSIKTTAITRESQETLVNQNPYFLLVIIVMALLGFALASFFIIKFIRNLVKTQLDLSDKVNQLAITNKELDEYAFTLTHYMQEPLRKIRLFISRFESKNKALFTEGGDIVKEKSFLSKAQESAEKAQMYLDEFLSYSRIIKESKLEVENIDLNILVEDVLKEHSTEIQRIQPTIEIDNLPIMEGNQEQIRLLFWHLIDNSLKYRNSNHHLKILIETVFDEKNTHIRISDNGIGFNSEYNEKVFNIFQRLHNAENFKGIGVGLSLCKKVVVGHNGTITASGTPEKGTTFDIVIPN